MANSSLRPQPDVAVSSNAKPPGAISSLEIYTIEEAKAQLGSTDSALRAAKRWGL